ncbi:hypothetical protein JYG23_12900 [Sedimentibacter sp. zth1]|uniref:hypothetical protein n=1 Tax=Sedimentibacter sp. zth1 TaxID=2816908 RepID=UPI001A91CF7F|nr:hypothetical protein [Sedimentibacter sp. zth1]QSX05558.1 hypothetical protein JYG23_12900 [Sedimentibacter sp. zth1]
MENLTDVIWNSEEETEDSINRMAEPVDPVLILDCMIVTTPGRIYKCKFSCRL